ncbi:endonuclease/exonuclease/phosphatase family protein [Pedobacter sp. GSP4]|uniref:endonuclease/exonuclease/phosphatase family protein n=1 Tax=Pedobacter sp. GSP4 TaxID=3453716 RepID=UPI003EE83EE8
MKSYHSLILITALLFSGCSPKIGSNTATKSISRFRVMSYNIHHCNPPSKEKAGTIDLNAVAKAIAAQHPDLVALQEVDVNTKRSGNINEAVLLAQKLKMNFYFGKAIDHDGGDYGVAILSRFPLSEQKTYMLPKNRDAKAEQRVMAIATVEVAHGKYIRFASTHLDSQRPEENRIMQVKELVKLTANETLPLILAGDLNAEPASETIRIFDAAFTRSCGNCGFTIPVINPKKTIDHIAFKKGNPFNVIFHEVVAERYASDHLPILSVIDLKP